MTERSDTIAQAQDEAVQLTSELIRIDTSNTGEPDTTVGEQEAAEYVAAQLSEVGYEVTVLESGASGRTNVFVRLEGADRERGALLIHGHLDVVPADPTEWSVHPFSGAIQDGYIWGRGAVDMKDMVGMMLAVARRFKRDGVVPPRDLVFAFFADEEAGGAFGAQWLVENRPDLFDGITEAIGEVGGFSITLAEDVRAYTIEIAEKGIAWMRLRVRGRAGHGSMLHDDNAVTKLAAAVARLGEHQFPLVVTDSVRAFLTSITELTGLEFDEDDLDRLRRQARAVRARRGGDAARHRQPDDAHRRLQGQRHPLRRRGRRRLPGAPGPRGRLRARARRDPRTGRRAGVGHPPAVRGDDLRRRARRRDDRRARRRGPGARRRSRTSCPAAPTPRRSRRWASAASASPRCACRPTWTSPPCSTASTSACRSTRCGSGPGCSTGSSATADPPKVG